MIAEFGFILGRFLTTHENRLLYPGRGVTDARGLSDRKTLS